MTMLNSPPVNATLSPTQAAMSACAWALTLNGTLITCAPSAPAVGTSASAPHIHVTTDQIHGLLIRSLPLMTPPFVRVCTSTHTLPNRRYFCLQERRRRSSGGG